MNTSFKEDKQAAAEAVLIQQGTAVFGRWLLKHPEANYDAAKKMLQEYMDFTGPLSEDDFEFAYGNLRNSNRIMPKQVPTPAEAKAALIDGICDLLRSPDGTGREGKYSNFNLTALRKQMEHWEISALTARRDEIVRAQRMVKQPLPELKQIVREAHTDPGFPRLPKTIVPAGQVVAVPLDAAYIKKLEPWEIRRLSRIYGQAAVNARLAGQ
jgi:hypothetical protein